MIADGRERPWTLFVLGRGVAGPGSASLSGEACGGDLVVAKCGGDDRRGQVEDVLSDRSGAGGGGGDSEGLNQCRQAAGLQWFAGAAAGEQPA